MRIVMSAAAVGTLLVTAPMQAQQLPGRGRFADDRLILSIEQRTPEVASALLLLPPHTERPLFRVPPRGWRDPAAARACGLERFVVLQFASPQRDLALRAHALADLPGVTSCECCALGDPGSTLPDDPDFPLQWALQPGMLDAPAAWDLVRQSTQLVGVIDSGCDLTHPELQASQWTNPGEIPANGIDDEGNGYVDDVHGWNFLTDDATIPPHPHGTRVAGCIAAQGDNALEIAGVCWSAPLLFAVVWGGGAPINVDDASAAVVYAADQGVRVAQMAWGFVAPEPLALRAAITYANSLDVMQVSLAGNQPVDEPLFPGARPEVLAVIATDSTDARASFSGFGLWCDLSAPGADIQVISMPGRPDVSSGTTFSSSHTSGAAALLREWRPDADAETIRLLLLASSKDLGVAGFDPDFGWGRLDLGAAMKLATTLTADRSEAAPGDDVVLRLDDPSAPFQLHALLVTRFGRFPGTPLFELDPLDSRVIFLNDDPLLWPLALGVVPGGDALFERFLECTDGSGFSQATMHLPDGPLLLGVDLDFAAALFDPSDLAHVTRLTATARVKVR